MPLPLLGPETSLARNLVDSANEGTRGIRAITVELRETAGLIDRVSDALVAAEEAGADVDDAVLEAESIVAAIAQNLIEVVQAVVVARDSGLALQDFLRQAKGSLEAIQIPATPEEVPAKV